MEGSAVMVVVTFYFAQNSFRERVDRTERRRARHLGVLFYRPCYWTSGISWTSHFSVSPPSASATTSRLLFLQADMQPCANDGNCLFRELAGANQTDDTKIGSAALSVNGVENTEVLNSY